MNGDALHFSLVLSVDNANSVDLAGEGRLATVAGSDSHSYLEFGLINAGLPHNIWDYPSNAFRQAVCRTGR